VNGRKTPSWSREEGWVAFHARIEGDERPRSRKMMSEDAKFALGY
jgi:hypothetical protein